MKIVATIRARMRSSRLPGKVMKCVLGKPLLQHLIERMCQVEDLDDVLVATSMEKSDDAIATLCKSLGVPFFRGSEEDVLGRVCETLKAFEVDVNVELTGDNPILDPAIVDLGLRIWKMGGYDMVTNTLKTTYPVGMEIRIYRTETLLSAESEIEDPSEREHASLCILLRPNEFRILNFEAEGRYRRPEVNLELDTAEDYELICRIHDELKDIPFFGLDHVLALFDRRPHLPKINKGVHRRWTEFFGAEVSQGVCSIPASRININLPDTNLRGLLR